MKDNVKILNGRIIKSIGGIYYVETPEGTFSCKAKGVFRNDGIVPLVGDIADIELYGEDQGVVSSIKPRKNELIRPPIANLDMLVFVVAACEPKPNFTVLDKLITISEYKDIEPLIVITKTDLAEYEYIESIYKNAGFNVIVTDNISGSNSGKVKEFMKNRLCAFAGNTGVGKSSLLNNIDEMLNLQTAEISKKLGRGRHTTRCVELYKLDNGGYVADTPGFSALETDQYEIIMKDKLQFCFREFEPYLQKCKFTDCSHTKEKGCAILEALSDGKIAQSRFNSYVNMYEEAKKIKEWEL